MFLCQPSPQSCQQQETFYEQKHLWMFLIFRVGISAFQSTFFDLQLFMQSQSYPSCFVRPQGK